MRLHELLISRLRSIFDFSRYKDSNALLLNYVYYRSEERKKTGMCSHSSSMQIIKKWNLKNVKHATVLTDHTKPTRGDWRFVAVVEEVAKYTTDIGTTTLLIWFHKFPFFYRIKTIKTLKEVPGHDTKQNNNLLPLRVRCSSSLLRGC